jgi:AraC-like DNA-binding protein
MPSLKDNTRPAIAYSCYVSKNREGEQFAPDHTFTYQVTGTMTMNDGVKEYIFEPGDFRFGRRNHLIKFVKTPPANGEFRSISVRLTQDVLRKYSIEHGYHATNSGNGDTVLQLNSNTFYKSFMDSLLPYLQLNGIEDEHLTLLKQQEAITLLLKMNPELKDILFDFSEPGKIDLEAFMNKNYHFNVGLDRFAYLTGRSLATFKRDFEKIFNNTPSRWLQQRRLQEAYFLIKEKGKAASDVYLNVGFEDLSHFSFAFKKQYGLAPSRI